MKIDILELRQMVKAGATGKMVVDHIEQLLNEARVRDAERKRRKRSSSLSSLPSNVHGHFLSVRGMSADANEKDEVFQEVQGMVPNATLSTECPRTTDTWLAADSPQALAWKEHEGKSRPMDSRGGWRYPAEWPPNYRPQAPVQRQRQRQLDFVPMPDIPGKP